MFIYTFFSISGRKYNDLSKSIMTFAKPWKLSNMLPLMATMTTDINLRILQLGDYPG